MALMTPQEYIDSLRKLNTRVYMFGEKIDNWVDHPMIRPSINCVAMTYALAQDPQYADLMTVKSSLTGHTINRFTHLHQSTEDLMNKVKMQRLLGQVTAACFQRCVGMDAINAVTKGTFLEQIERYAAESYSEAMCPVVTKLKELTDRAGVSAPSSVTADFLLEERARELMWEGHRRTDLIRYGKFTTPSFLWTYKGGTFTGQGFDDYMKIFAIPSSELASNPELHQNPGYGNATDK